MASKEPLRRLIRITRMTDRDIRRALRDAAQEADRIIRSLEGQETYGARVRAAQANLSRMHLEMWQDIDEYTREGVGRARISAADLHALGDVRLARAAGMSLPSWRASMIAQAQSGIDAYLARRHNGYTLSQRVYRNTALSRGYVERTINNGLLLGKSAAEIATDVRKFISPDVPGGASYAAMRLGRTEIANAFHTRTVDGYAESPWTPICLWNLSGSHGHADTCDDYADDTHFRGGQAGEFRSTEVPSKPHPQCLCFITPVQVDEETFIREFQAGHYDDYIDGIIGNSSRAVG